MAAEDEPSWFPTGADEDVGAGEAVAWELQGLGRVHHYGRERVLGSRVEPEAHHCSFLLEMQLEQEPFNGCQTC